ncbi:MAG: response regulator transcription factor [Acidobacteriia bacterium]|nr:response regulator transcription factor [Terriglobia bacterium]
MSIRVLIADDHSMIRTGLRALLKSDPDVTVVGEAGDGRETFRLVEELAPDVVLLDISMPGEDGIQVAKRLKGSFPKVRVLFLTMHEDAGLMREAIQAGAAGYVIKRAEEAEILNAVHAAHRGDLYVHPAMTRAFLEPRPSERRPTGLGGVPLTRREVDILKMLARGHTNRQIAEGLGLSVRTVEGHRAALMGKLGVSSRVELVTYAEENGLL